MRMKLFFKLENNVLDIQYRKGIISWIKHAIQDYDDNLFQEIYQGNQKKTFCFASILSKPDFQEDRIVMQNNQFSVIFSAYNYSHALHLYNSFLKQKFQKFSLNKNSMTLTSISMIPENTIQNNSLIVKMISPLIVRNHDRVSLKDMYYAFDREEFQQYIRINIAEQLDFENLDTSLLEGFTIEAIQAKKIVIPVYEKKIECSIGIFNINGKIALLDYLYKAGIGTKKAMGFGLFEIQ